MKHTPGPWRRLPRSRAIGNALFQVCSVNGLSTGGRGRSSTSEALANAHLIAAAPEMLEVLEEIVDRLVMDDMSGYDETQARALELAQAVVIKARGGR